MKRSMVAVALVLAGWVGLGVRTEAADAKGNLRYTITVSKFDNKAGWHGQWDLGDAWGTVMTAALQESGHFIVLGEKDMRGEAMAEQDLAESGRVAGGNKAPKKGFMTPAQLLVKGDITHVQDSTTGGEGGLNFKGISLGGGKDTCEINATIYLVDSRTGQVKASTKVVGKAGRKGLKIGYSGGALGGLTGDMGGFKKDNVGKATEDAITQAVEFLKKQVESIPWEGSVASVKDDGKILINRGTREGVEVGQTFKVGTVDETVDNDTGEVLDRSVKKVGTIKVTEAKEKISICEATDGGKKIEKGMSVQPE
jgi:curli biogenesis system outer membrane secretion channel CsgG